MAFTLTSSAFEHEGTVPQDYTCDGADKSPALQWSDVPEGTKSFVLIMDDPDAPVGTWDHWVYFNIPADKTGLAEGVAKEAELPDGSKSGLNSWKKHGYGGPCPPPGPAHRYFFKLYALDTMLDLPGAVDKAAVEAATKGHVLGETQLMGKFGR